MSDQTPDIVAELRDRSWYIAGENSLHEEQNRDLMRYAADEIERLREHVAELRDEYKLLVELAGRVS